MLLIVSNYTWLLIAEYKFSLIDMNHVDKKYWANKTNKYLFCKTLYIHALTWGFPIEQGKVFGL